MDDKTGRMNRPGTDESELRTQEIREEIAQTRVDMSETIEAIQERLTPSHLVAQAGETVRNATTEKVKQMANTAEYAADQVMDSSFARTVKENPIPAAMIGIGTAWLIAKGRSASSGHRRSQDSGRYRTSDAYGSGQRDWRVGQPSEGAVGTTGYIDYGSGVPGESSRVPEFGGQMHSYDRGYRAPVNLERVVRDNPLVVGAAAALVGVAIGMSLPASETENRLMGEARDNVVDRAKGLASDAAEKVQDVAGQAASAATQVRDAAKRATGDGRDLQGSGNIGSTGNVGGTGNVGNTGGTGNIDSSSSFESGRSADTPSTSRTRSTTRRTT